PRLLVQGLRQLQGPAIDQQILAPPGGEAVVPRVPDRPFGTGARAVGAEETAAQVEPQPPLLEGDCIGGARLNAFAAAVPAFRRVDGGQATEAVRQRWWCRRVGDRAVALPEPG